MQKIFVHLYYLVHKDCNKIAAKLQVGLLSVLFLLEKEETLFAINNGGLPKRPQPIQKRKKREKTYT